MKRIAIIILSLSIGLMLYEVVTMQFRWVMALQHLYFMSAGAIVYKLVYKV